VSINPFNRRRKTNSAHAEHTATRSLGERYVRGLPLHEAYRLQAGLCCHLDEVHAGRQHTNV
jgi:hypothetical protein